MIALPLLVAALAGDGAALAPERSGYVGTVFAREVQTTLVVVNPLRRTLQPYLAFEASCSGDKRVGAVWSGNLRTRERLELEPDRSFDATLTAKRRGVGPLREGTARYTWRLRGRLVDRETITARLSGRLVVEQGRRRLLRCVARTPAALTMKVDQSPTTSASSTRLPSGSRR